MRYYAVAAVLIIPAGLALTPLGRGSPPAGKDQGWGLIKGRIVYAGSEVPKPEKVTVDKDAAHCLSKGDLFKEDWVVNPKNKGVRWTIVWLAPEPDREDSLPIHPKLKKFEPEVFMDQPCCQFVPHCMGVRVGQKLVVKNSAPVAHSVRWGGNRMVVGIGGNTVVPAGKAQVIDNLTTNSKVKVPIVTINCDYHKWMNARVVVLDHPYFAITDKDGKFQIQDAPAGHYRLKIWHEKIGWRGGVEGKDGLKVTITPNKATDLGELGIAPSKE